MKKIELNLEKLTLVMSYDMNISGDENDPVTKIIEERKGKILKIFQMIDGATVAVCQGKE